MPGTFQRVPKLGAGPGWAGAGTALPGLQRPSRIKAAVQVDGSDAFLTGWALPPPLLGEEGKSLSGNVNFKGLDRKAYSQTVLSLLDKASCLERLWGGLFKATVDPQPTLCTYESPRLKRSETSDLPRVTGRKGVPATPTPGKHEGVSDTEDVCGGVGHKKETQTSRAACPHAASRSGAVSALRQGSPSWHRASPLMRQRWLRGPDTQVPPYPS